MTSTSHVGFLWILFLYQITEIFQKTFEMKCISKKNTEKHQQITENYKERINKSSNKKFFINFDIWRNYRAIYFPCPINFELGKTLVEWQSWYGKIVLQVWEIWLVGLALKRNEGSVLWKCLLFVLETELNGSYVCNSNKVHWQINKF